MADSNFAAGRSFEPLPGGQTRVKTYAQGGALLSDEIMSAEEAVKLVKEPIVEQRLSEKDRQALKAAEDYVIDRYTDLTRSTTDQWDLDPEDAAKLEFNDAPGRQDGYLMACIESSRIVAYDAEEKVWRIEVVPDIGIEVEPEEWDVYQAQNGEWIVEHL